MGLGIPAAETLYAILWKFVEMFVQKRVESIQKTVNINLIKMSFDGESLNYMKSLKVESFTLIQ